MESFEEFKAAVQKRNSKRRNKINNSVGVRQGFLFLQKRKWVDVGRPITEKQFQQIVRNVNKALSNLLIEKKSITFPHNMGTLEIRSRNNMARYSKDGKLILPKVIDWSKTLELWYSDKEAYDNKILIRDLHPTKIAIIYNRKTANYNNKNYFNFILNRNTQRVASSMLREGLLETFSI